MLGQGTSRGTFESTQNPPTNTVTVTAATESGGPATITDTASDTYPPVQISPFIDVSKNCVAKLAVQNNTVVVRVDFGGTVCAGDQISLTNVTVVDDHAGQVFSTPLLAKGTCQTYTGSYFPSTVNSPDPELATFSDTVTATGTARLGFGTVTDTATANCPLCPPVQH